MNDSKHKRMKLSTNDIIVLGLVYEGQKDGLSGKELEKMVKDRGMRNWTTIGTSSIYYSLKKLEKLHLINSKKMKILIEGKPPINSVIYSIQPLGIKQLNFKTNELIVSPERFYDPFDVAIAFSWPFGSDSMIKNLKKRLMHIEENLQTLIQMAKPFTESKPANLHFLIVKALFTKPIAKLEGEKKWIESFIDEIKNLPKEVS